LSRSARLILVAGGLTLAGVGALAAASGYYGSDDGESCGRCHEIRPMVEALASSSHRELTCADCHGSSLSADLRMHVKNLSRLWIHSRGESPEQIRLKQADLAPLMARCAGCHAQEHATWQSGPHAASYERIFLDEAHNREQRLMDDCLRCHGMHYEGGIRDLVSPLDREGPWRLRDAHLAGEPAIPCVTCHGIHRPGVPRAAAAPDPPVQEATAVASLAFLDRRGGEPIGVAALPLPAMRDGDRRVAISPDPRQALCYQCHAARAGFQVFSGDDRTPTGVHEGLSCFACHAGHAVTTRASCAGCHPRLSNCGLEVEEMDTSFRAPDSAHDIHSVACAGCHPGGVPAPPRRARRR
jgi:hypothetical protein